MLVLSGAEGRRGRGGPARGPGLPTSRSAPDTGLSMLELLIVVSLLAVIVTFTLGSFGSLIQLTTRESSKSNLISSGRGAVELVARILRTEFVQFNTVPNTPLGVDFDLNNDAGQPLVRDALLFYVDTNHNAQIFVGSTAGQPQSAGLDDANGDGLADVFGVGLVRQDLDRDGVQDFVDADNDGQPDDVDRDTQADPLWTLTLVRFNRIADVSDPVRWLNGQQLVTQVIVQKLVPSGALTGGNIRAFRFSAHNSLAMAYDRAEWTGNENGNADEFEIGNIETADGIINTAAEAASIDSISLSLVVAQVARQGLGRTTVERGDIGSDLITPRALTLIRANGMTGLPDPTRTANIR